MSVENKIKELLARTEAKEQRLTEETDESLQEGEIVAASTKAAAATTKDTSKAAKAGTAGDTTQPKQGSSEVPSVATMDEDEALGAKASAGVTKAGLPTSKGDAKSAKTPAMEQEEVEGEAITEEEQQEEQQDTVDVSAQLNSIFGEELSEEFKTKATSIFEAAVIARVNSEIEKITSKLEEQNQSEVAEFKESLVSKVDSYLNYVVEQWMEENTLAIESGLRTEIAEDFITGLKTLFQEHYIEVPEEKYDVLDELQQKVEALETSLNQSIEENVAVSSELSELKKAKIFEEQTKELAATEVEKLKKLVEGVDFDTEELYREKVAVIKENYFPKAQKTSPEKVLSEATQTAPATFDNGVMNKYVQSLSRTIKTR